MKKIRIIFIIVAVALVAFVVFSSIEFQTDKKGDMAIPQDKMFDDSPLADTNEEFDISFTFDDTLPSEFVEGESLQPIR